MSDEAVDEWYRPSRGYSWAPFTEGNDASMRHGAKSERRLRPLVDAFVEHLVQVAPWTAMPAFRPTVEAWAWAEARAELYRRHFDEIGLVDANGEPTPGQGELERAEGRAKSLRKELGLSPTTLASLLRSLGSIDGPAAAAGIEALRATGAEIRAAADRAALPAAGGGSEEGETDAA